jgi:hypothetical protein
MVLAFVNTSVNQATGLVANLQKLVDKNKAAGLRGYVVFQGGAELKNEIQKLAAQKKISIPMAYMMHGRKDPGLAMYQISPQAKTTILVTNRKKVTANFVNLAPNQLQPVATAAQKMLASSG